MANLVQIYPRGLSITFSSGLRFSGSGHISVTDHSASCTGLVHLPSSSLCVQCPRAQSLTRYCSFCTWVISVAKHGLRLYAYVDDSQLTLHFRRDKLAASIERLERCIDVDQWISANRLMLNVDKTEWLLVGSRRTLSSLDITRPVLQLGGNIVAASDQLQSRPLN